MIKQIFFRYNDLMGILSKITGMVAAAILASLFSVMTLEIVSRFFFRMSYGWVIEFARFGLIYVVFLAGSILFYHQEHISITLLPDRLSPKAVEVLRLAFNIVTLYFLYLVFRSGYSYALLGATVRSPSGLTYLIVPRMATPIGAVLMALQVLNNTFKGIDRLASTTPEQWRHEKATAKSQKEKIVEEIQDDTGSSDKYL